jgi:copper(I)-binding protein
MKLNAIFAGAAAFALLSSAAFADIMVMDPYARAAGKSAKAGAAFMVIENTSGEDDRLIGAASDIAKKVELHTHKDMGDGVMKMIHVEEGFVIPAGGKHMLMRGGDHVMFMGLNSSMDQGNTVKVTLTFEKAGDIEVDIPVDLDRKPQHGMAHGTMKKTDN